MPQGAAQVEYLRRDDSRKPRLIRYSLEEQGVCVMRPRCVDVLPISWLCYKTGSFNLWTSDISAKRCDVCVTLTACDAPPLRLCDKSYKYEGEHSSSSVSIHISLQTSHSTFYSCDLSNLLQTSPFLLLIFTTVRLSGMCFRRQ